MNQTLGVKDIFSEKETSGLQLDAQGAIWGDVKVFPAEEIVHAKASG